METGIIHDLREHFGLRSSTTAAKLVLPSLVVNERSVVPSQNRARDAVVTTSLRAITLTGAREVVSVPPYAVQTNKPVGATDGADQPDDIILRMSGEAVDLAPLAAPAYVEFVSLSPDGQGPVVWGSVDECLGSTVIFPSKPLQIDVSEIK